MAQRVEKLSFGYGSGETFRLETRFHPEAPDLKHRILFHGNREVKVERRTLDLLSIFLQQPKTPIGEKELEARIWGRDSEKGGNVEQQVYKLRTALNDHAVEPRFIETLPKFGYRFLVDVRSEESLGEYTEATAKSLKILEQWNHEKFTRFLGETTRGEGPDEEGDLRILTTAFSSGVPDVLLDLLDKNVRIKILLVNESLITARNQVRLDGHKPAKALKTSFEQRETLETMKRRSSQGSLDMLETDVMPCGIIIHSRNGALVGLFLATESYVRGPMIEVGPRSKLWEILRSDWNELWKDAERKSRTSQPASD